MKIIASLTFLAFVFCAALLDTARAQPLTITTIAGQFGVSSYHAGTGASALFVVPLAVGVDKTTGNIYVLDDEAVRKIAPDLSVTVLAGSPTHGGYYDGTGTSALFDYPSDLVVDANGYIYVADTENYVIRKVSPGGMVTTLAGNGYPGHTDANSTNAQFFNLLAIAVDSSGNVYVADGAYYPGGPSIRKITPAGTVSTLAGGFSGNNDGNGTNAQFSYATGLAVDNNGTIYVADGWGIRKVSPAGDVTTWVGNRQIYTETDGLLTAAGFAGAEKIALDRSGGAYVSDANTIRYVSAAGAVSTAAGTAGQNPTTSNDGVGSAARFGDVSGICVDGSGNLCLVDKQGYTVLAGVPPSLDPIGSFSESPGGTPVRFNNPWQFTANYPTIISDLRLRVQSTTTTNDESSWTDLPGNPDMTDNDGNWTLNSTNVPTGTRYFRAIASAPGYFDRASAAVGPETVLGPPQLPPIGSFGYSTGGTPVRSSNPWQFSAYYTNLVSGLKLRVQSTITTNNEGSWADLPDGGQMTNQDVNWTLNTTDVPTGTRYFRVIASAPGYLDGASAALGPQEVLEGIAPFGFFKWETTYPNQTATLWVFNIDESSFIPGLDLRVQANEDRNGWNDLPNGHMTRFGSTWALNTTNLPTGQVSFRVIASAQDYMDRVSATLGPFTIHVPLPIAMNSISSGGSYTLDAYMGPDPQKIYFDAVQAAVVKFGCTDTVQYNSAVNLAGEQYAEAVLQIEKSQNVPILAVNMGQNSTLILKGGITGDVSLIGQDGSGVVSNDGGSLTHDQGEATVISNDGGSIIGENSSGLISQDGGGLISQDGGGILNLNGGAVVNRNIKGFTSGDNPFQPKPNTPLPTQPTFTGQMTITGNYSQFAGTTLMIGIAGTNTLGDGAQQYDQLVVSGTANLIGGTIAFELFDPDDQTNRVDIFQPPDGSTFDVVVASNIVVGAVHLRGPVWGDGLFFKGGVVTRMDGLQAVRLVATHIPPHLFIQSANSGLNLVYGTNYTGYAVESSPDLVNWSAFSTGTNVVILSSTNASQFFRLSKP